MMHIHRLDSMVRGWFVGDFEPSVYRAIGFEVAVQHFKAGDCEQKHIHKIATEITVIVVGQAEMNGHNLSAGDIVTLQPGMAANFRAITDVTTTVVKVPAAKNDKFLVGEEC